MPTYSASQTFWAYEDKDGKLATPLYDGHAPATKYLVDKKCPEAIKTLGPYPAFDYSLRASSWKEQQEVYKEYGKKVRTEAKRLIREQGHVLVTFRLVKNAITEET